MEAVRTRAHGPNFIAAEAAAAVAMPGSLFAFRPGPRVALVFGVLWSACGGRPGSVKVSAAAVAAVLFCDVRSVRVAIDGLVALGLVERYDHDGITYWLRLQHPDDVAKARRLVADPQRLLFEVEQPAEGEENSAQNFPPLHEHEHELFNSCSMSMRGENPAQNFPTPSAGCRFADPQRLGDVLPLVRSAANPPPTAPLGDAAALAERLRREVGDPAAPAALFRDVATAIIDGRLVFDRVKGIVHDLQRGRREGRIRSPGAVFRSAVAALFEGGPPWQRRAPR